MYCQKSTKKVLKNVLPNFIHFSDEKPHLSYLQKKVITMVFEGM